MAWRIPPSVAALGFMQNDGEVPSAEWNFVLFSINPMPGLELLRIRL
jgi:hypothetical protein